MIFSAEKLLQGRPHLLLSGVKPIFSTQAINTLAFAQLVLHDQGIDKVFRVEYSDPWLLFAFPSCADFRNMKTRNF